ncbi:unnamed protein product, partial [Medioppia subpectinata]
MDERVVKRRQLKRKFINKGVIRKPVVEDIKPKHNKTSVKTNTKTNSKQMNDKNEDMSEESVESYVESKTYKAIKRHKPTKNFKERQKMFDLTTNSYKCQKTECKKRCETDEAFQCHLYRNHTNPVFKCDYNGCRYKCDSDDNLRDHRQRHNTTNRGFVCDLIGCEKTFTTRRALRDHRRRHQSEPTYKCSTHGCVELFFTKQQRHNHQVSVHSRKPSVYSCDFIGCEKTFTTAGGLVYHRRRHESEPTFKCSTNGCDDMFFTIHQCHKHEMSVHSRALKPRRIYRCDWPGCEWTGHNIHPHKLRHTGEKPFPCLWPECGKRFPHVFALKQHMNIHNNVKPYVCHWPGCTHSYV